MRLGQVIDASSRDLLLVHLVFAALTIAVLAGLASLPIGARMLLALSIYNILILVVALARKHHEWIDIWLFAFPLSILQVIPDLILSAQLDVLAFPNDGFLMIGTVPAYMAALWVVPIFVIIYVALQVQKARSVLVTYLVIALLSLAIFGVSEETMWMLPSWMAKNVLTVGHVALYIIIPEILLGLSAFMAYIKAKEGPFWKKIAWAYLVMVLYLGNASLFYFLIQHVALGA